MAASCGWGGLARGMLLGVALLPMVVACSSAPTYRAHPGPYDRVPKEWAGILREARSDLTRGDARTAHDLLRPLVVRRPKLLPVAVLFQDAQLSLLEAGEEVGGVRVPDGLEPRAVLADLYLEQADARPTAAGYVLAARLQQNGASALSALDRASEADPDCVWVQYGRAFWQARMRLFPEARKSVRRAFRRDSGHLPTVRLSASLLAGAGDTGRAIGALEVWLDRTEDDPLTDPTTRAEALVDLAALQVMDEDPGEALSILADVLLTTLRDPARAELVRSSALQDLGQSALALSAARRARDLDPEGLLPLVHQAMLYASQGDTAREEVVWRQVLEASEDDAPKAPVSPGPGAGAATEELDLGTVLLRLRAKARLGRIEAERGSSEAGESID